MLERITNADPVFANPLFLAEEALFFQLHRLPWQAENARLLFPWQAGDALLLTDREAILLVQTSPDRPAWIWTRPNLGGDKLAVLREAVALHQIKKVTARPEIGPLLYQPAMVHERLLANECRALRTPQGVDGACGRHTPGEDLRLARMLAGCYREIERVDSGENAESYLPAAKKLRENPDFAIWRNDAGNPVAMARLVHRAARHALINMVYTEPAHRRRGYAGAVVASLCGRAISEGLLPILYTDAANLAANRAYQKIGFGTVGSLVIVGAEGAQ